MVLDASDLWIDRITPTGDAGHPFASISVSFSAPVDASTFDLSDVSITGTGTPSVSAITRIDATHFEIATTGTTGVVSSLVIGPGIVSQTGGGLDTNRNGTGGETGDAYRATLADGGITIGAGDGSYDGTNLIVVGGTSTIVGGHAFASLQTVGGSLAFPGGVLTLLGDSRIGGDLTITGGIVSLGASLTLAGTTRWSGGTISGGAPENTGTLQIVGPDNVAYLQDTTLDNFGTIAFTSSNRLRLYASDGTKRAGVRNEPTGVLDFRVDDGQFGASIVGSADGRVANLGTIRKSGGGGTNTFTAPLDNQGGTIDVQVGAIMLAANAATTSTGGTFTVAAGAALHLTNAGGNGTNNTLSGTYTGSGGGKVIFAGGALGIGASGATFNFPAGMFEWNGGTIYGGPLTNSGTMQIVGPDNIATLQDTTLDNFGTIAFTSSNRLRLYSSDGTKRAGVRNEPTGVIDFRVDDGQFGASLLGGVSDHVLNLGTIRKSGGGTTTTFSAPLDNQGGTIDVQTGAIVLAANGAATSTGGTFSVNTGATLYVTVPTGNGTSNSLSGVYAGAGGGKVVFAAGTLNIGASGATFNFPAGMFEWSGGTIKGGTLTNTGFMTTVGTDTKYYGDSADAVFVNAGTFRLAGSGMPFVRFAGGVTNTATGIVEFAKDESLRAGALSPSLGLFLNRGIIRSVDDVTQVRLDAALDNTAGTVQASSGILNLVSFAAGYSTSYTHPYQNDPGIVVTTSTLESGRWIATSGATLGLGSIDVNAAELTLVGPGSRIIGMEMISTNTGTIRLEQGATFRVNDYDTQVGLSIRNAGVIDIGPGSSFEALKGFLQSPSGVARVAIGGAPESGAVGRLVFRKANWYGVLPGTLVGDTPMLDGRLDVVLANGFGPTAGQVYDVVTLDSPSVLTGSFSSITGLRSGRFPLFTVTQGVQKVSLTAVADAADVAATSVAIAESTAAPGGTVAISYGVSNVGTTTAVGPWYDTFFLSDDTVLDPGDVQIGRVRRQGDLAAGGSYTGQFNATLPAVAGLKRVIMVSDSTGLVPDLNRGNNTAVSTLAVRIEAPQLAVGGSSSGSLAASEGTYYAVTVPAGPDVRLDLGFTGVAAPAVYVRQGDLPSPAAFDLQAPAGSGSRQLVLPGSRPGTYYVLIQAPSNTGTAFTIAATAVPFALSGVSPTRGSNVGSATIVLSGLGFSPAARVRLRQGDTVIDAGSISYASSNQLVATFDLRGLAVGSATIELTDGSRQASIPDGFTVTADQPGKLEAHITGPKFVRSGRPMTLTVDFANTGDTEIPAQVLVINGGRWVTTGYTYPGNTPITQYVPGLFRLPGQTDWTTGGIMVLAAPADGPYGVIPPGYRGSLTVQMAQGQDLGGHETIDYAVSTVDPSETIDWGALKAGLKPVTLAADAWDVIFANFTARAGSTWGEFERVLAADAANLAGRGQPTRTVSDLVGFEMLEAGDYGSIEERYRLGALGRGFVDPTDYSYSLRAENRMGGELLVVRTPGSIRTFRRSPGGIYVSTANDGATAELTAGGLSVREKTGETASFAQEGGQLLVNENLHLAEYEWHHLNYLADRLGNRITPTYTDGRITAFTSSATGDAVTYGYDANGRIVTATDAVGRVTSYAYDTSGEHLTGITTSAGTISYAWTTGQGAAREHALASITLPDGSRQEFAYDARGRIVSSSVNGGLEQITYSHPEPGVTIATDAGGRSTSVSLDQFGRPVQTRYSSGAVASSAYDADNNLTSVSSSAGGAVALGYDGVGNLFSQTDANGSRLLTSYDPRLNLPTSFADGLGRLVRYEYDSKGNQVATVYPDGTADRYAYDQIGNVISWTNRAGAVTAFQYDVKNLLIARVQGDGTTTTFSYDAHRNLTAIVDGSGTIGFSYDTADRLVGVSYPGAKTLAYTYDSAGRRTSLTDEAGNVTRYAYDAAGRLVRVSDTADRTIAAYTLDAAGFITRRDLGNGGYVTYTYTAAGVLDVLANHAADGTIVSSYDYDYDGQGRVTSMTTLEGTTTYQYDANSQLVGVTLPGGRAITYRYDAAGNRTSVTDGTTTTLYVVNSLNQYTQIGDTAYQYDARGFLVSATSPAGTTRYSYDGLGHLTTVVSPSGRQDYRYDALGHVVAATRDGEQTAYVWDPTGIGAIVGEYSGTGALRYAYGVGLEGRADGAGAATAFYAYDGRGNTSAVLDAAGSVLNAYSYLPFGEKLATTGAGTNTFTFAGQAGVADLGGDLYSMRARWYAPAMGRFTQPDPTGLAGGDLNLYRYVVNSPVNLLDATGFSPDPSDGYTGTMRNAIENFESWDQNNQGAVRALYGDQRKETVKKSEEFLNDIGTQLAVPEIKIARLGVDKIPLKISPTLPYQVVKKGPVEFVKDKLKGYAKKLTIQTLKDNLYLVNPPQQNVEGKDTRTKLDQLKKDLNVKTDSEVIVQLRHDRLLKNLALGRTEGVNSDDPNDILGPAGFGTDGFIQSGLTLPYTIQFENKASATAPAQEVFIRQQLDADLDFSTFVWGDFMYGGRTFSVPQGQQSVRMRIDDSATTGLFVDVAGDIDAATGLVTWTFRSLDPSTLDLPADPLAGFLPPNTQSPIGDGSISYSIRSKDGSPSGTRIDAQARIIFDTNAPIDTPAILNTVDVGTPSSAVQPLPATTADTSFTVAWAGSDDVGGSGIATYDVYVSDNGAAYTLWQAATTDTSGSYTGQREHTYRFYTVATDNVGYRQATPAAAQAQVTVNHAAPTDIGLSPATVAENQPVGTVVGTLSSTDAEPGKNYTYTFVNGTGSADNASFTIDGSTLKTAATFNVEAKASFSVRIRTTDNFGGFFDKVFTISVTNVNESPTDIALSAAAIAENQASGTTVGTFSTTDPDTSDTFTYTLVSGSGSTDNASFTIEGNALKTAASFNYEAQSSYSIRVRSTDAGGLFTDKVFTISVTNVNESPTDIALSAAAIAENQPSGTTVGTLSTADPDTSDTFTYTLVSGSGSTDNGSFTIDGNALKTAASFNYEAQSSYSIRVRSTDAGGLFTDKVFTISVTNVNESPTDIALSAAAIAENQPSGTTVGMLSTTDPDAGGIFTYTLVSGSGSTDNASFTIDGNALKTAASFNYEAQSSYSIRIRSTDAGGLFTEKTFTVGVTDVVEPLATDHVEPPVARSYRAGEVLSFTLVLTRPVAVTGKPAIDLTLGKAKTQAVYASGSGTNRLVFSYTVKAGDTAPAGVVLGSTIRLPAGARIRMDTTNLPVALPAVNTSGVRVDTTPPKLTGVSGPVAGSLFREGQIIQFTAVVSEPIAVTGQPMLQFWIGSAHQKQATYVAAASSQQRLVFQYTVQAGDNGAVAAKSLSLSGATAVDGAGNSLATAFSPPALPGVAVDTVRPSIAALTAPVAKTYRAGQAMDFTVALNEPVRVSGTPTLPVEIGSAARSAAFVGFVKGSGNKALIFRAIPQAGDVDTDGVRVTGPVNATGATIADLAGNAAILTLPAADTHKILVDGVAPSILSVAGPTLDAKRTSLTVRVTFSEPVVVTGSPRIGFTLGGAARQLTYTQGSKSQVLTFTYALKNTDNGSAAVVLGNAISLAGNATITDVVGNGLLSLQLPQAAAS